MDKDKRRWTPDLVNWNHNVYLKTKNDDYFMQPTFVDVKTNQYNAWVPLALAGVGSLMVFPAYYYFQFLRYGEPAQKEDLATAHYILMTI